MADEHFGTILTKSGKAKIANAVLLGSSIQLKTLKVGDSNGEYYEPVESQTELKNELYSCEIGSIKIDKDNPNWVVVETILPGTVGGFTIREVGICDSEDNLIAISKYPATYKPVIENGAGKDVCIRLIIEVSNPEQITLNLDPNVIIATKEDINELQGKIDDNMYEKAQGTGKEIKLSMKAPLKNGYYKKFIACEDNGGAVTTVNGKPLYKACSTNAPILKKDRPYEIYYNAESDCFFLKASATGMTSADKVLAGETFSTENDTDLVGTMPNRGSINKVLNVNDTIKLPAGYYEDITISQNIPDRGEFQYAGSVGNGADYLSFCNIPAGYYHKKSENWAPEIRAKLTDVVERIKTALPANNLKEMITSCGGLNRFDGTVKSSSDRKDFWADSKTKLHMYTLTINGYDFMPKIAVAWHHSSSHLSIVLLTDSGFLFHVGYNMGISNGFSVGNNQWIISKEQLVLPVGQGETEYNYIVLG